MRRGHRHGSKMTLPTAAQLSTSWCVRTTSPIGNVPAVDAAEGALVEDIAVYPAEHLAQLVAHLRGEQPIAPYVLDGSPLDSGDDTISPYDLANVGGQEHVKRARSGGKRWAHYAEGWSTNNYEMRLGTCR